MQIFNGAPIAKKFCRGDWGEFQGRADEEKWGGVGWAIGDPSPNLKNLHNKKLQPGKGSTKEASSTEEPRPKTENGKIIGA